MKIRRFLSCFQVLLIVSVITICFGTLAHATPSENPQQTESSRELRVLAFGGAYTDVLKKNLEDTNFEKEYNCKVTFVSAEGADTLVKMNNKEVDVIFTDPLYSMRAERMGLAAKIVKDKVPNISKCYDIACISDYTVLHDVGAYGIAYNPALVSEPPKSWKILWDKKYARKVVIRGFRADTIELMVWAAKQRGGDERHIDPGFETMAELAKNVYAFAQSHPEILSLFQSGDVALGIWTDGRVAWAQEKGVPIKFSLPEEGGFLLMTSMNIVKDCTNIDLAYAYVNMELGVDAQVNIGEDLGYFPMNKDAYPKLSDNVRAKMAFTPSNIENAQRADWRYIESVYDEWAERWEIEVVGKAR